MRTILLGIMAIAFSFHGQAQNKNVTDVTKTTTTKVNTNEGEKKFVKEENVKEVQNIELKDEKANTLNIETKPSAVSVTSTTKITNPDGSTRTVDIDRSSYYTSNGNRYQLVLDASGYTMTDGLKKPALLRKTTTNSYVYRNKNKTAIGYFDVNGNLVLETYDDKTDKVLVETYTIIKK